ncbi:Uncharacterised protein [Chryseobacterium nakagawai]|uniref:Uncharacterized protein n=1 Tax=Chryseobacterium nakagawai TaxID=1241982 RepID=A0AAD0YL97_CHRNA|nr:hypothetical protein [Chryseobacterium nakagawai]AZA90579.1 hypothetical protein EG343_08065 [Chryseobacterium nakagawai]VEH22089.1 Uncharacterised protein [Chryseobacterium nakagawai]
MLKILSFLWIAVYIMTACNCAKGKNDASKKDDGIISKIYHKSGSNDTDTLWVSQNDSTVFRQEEVMIKHPDSYPKLTVRYNLINPKNNAYYFIYNDKQQLIEEGKYTAQYMYEGITYNDGNFYNLKSYSYKKNGKLRTKHYQEDGRNFKTEFFNNDGQLTEIKYFNKKSSDIEKVEIYKKGELKETRIYKGFNNYDTVKAGE